MIDVSSRPESIHEQEPDEDENDLEPTISLERTESKGLELERDKDKSDVRSIRSVSSMMSKEDSSSGNKNERATISNRLASIGVLGRLGNAPTTDEFGGQSADASPSKVSLSTTTSLLFHDKLIIVDGQRTVIDFGFGPGSRRLPIWRRGRHEE
jgi:hypothetical protein